MLGKSPFFPPLIIDMIAVGEESGHVEDSLIRVADGLDREIENILKALTSMLEPVLILSLALVVGFIVLAMLLPVFEMSSMVQ
jgi:type II secretory pathway component PulF